MRNPRWLLWLAPAFFALVLASCGSENTDNSNQAAVPGAPTGVTASGGFQKVTLSWGAVGSATSYNLYWAKAAGVTPATGTRIPSVSSPYVHQSLTAGTTYYYVVTAQNSVGESAPSAEVSAVPTSTQTVPVAPTGVTASAGVNQVTVAWSPVSDATSYNIYWSATVGVTPATGTPIVNAVSPFTLTALTAGTTYYFVVTAVNATGEGNPSTQVSAVPTATATVPAAPIGVMATSGTNSVTLSWNAVTGATSYTIYRATLPGVTPAIGTELTGATSPYVDHPLIAGDTYYYVVTATNGTGEGNPSVQVFATTSTTDGIALYGSYCSGCHNPLATTEKSGRTAAQIQAAIDSNRGGMISLSFLTPAQVQAIADVLNF